MTAITKNPFSSLDNGSYYGEISIEIGCTSPNAIIYYTLDGTIPTTSSLHINANTEITISSIGSNIITCFALSPNYSASSVVTFNYQILERLNLTTTNTSDNILTSHSPLLEPINSNGAQPYIDLTQFLSRKIREQDDFMELVYVFQDYLNNGFRVIPYFKKEIVVTNKQLCSSKSNTTYEYLEPYNHTIDMLLDYENASQDLDNLISIEQYDRNRDIDTFSIDSDLLETYKTKYSDDYYDSVFYKSFVYYRNLNELKTKTITYPFDIFLSTIDSYKTNNSDLDAQFMLRSEILSKLSGITSQVTINIYFCGYEDFVEHFKYTGAFSVSKYFYPTFYNKIDMYNELDDVFEYYGDYSDKATFISKLQTYSNRFRVSVNLSNIQLISTLTDIDYPMTVVVHINNESELNTLPINIPLLSQRFLVIKKWQDPEIFYNYFNSQNEYRIDDKASSILDKIRKIAYSHDPDVIDYEYIDFIASQMGYNIDLDRDDIENNGIYATAEEKEQALRSVIRNLPNFYKIKCTKNGLEALLLSFGIVGDIVYLYTIGNNKKQGYADFIDSRLIEGYNEDGQYTSSDMLKLKEARAENGSLANSVISDWFPSPHFRVELDLLTQNLRINKNKLGIALINSAVKKTKPINTVFQGFYGKMTDKFAELFIYAPKGMTTGYIRTNVGNNCVIIDTWIPEDYT
jgi:hypothetical protein